MNPRTDVLTSLKSFILTELVDGRDISTLDDADQLLETGIIDSLGIIKLLSFIEETFSITITADELIPENFSTPRSLSLLVSSKLLN